MIHLIVSITDQSLSVFDGKDLLRSFSISTALNGSGQRKNSGCTPLGLHAIRAKIGEDHPENAVFRGRRFTGEIYSSVLGAQFPKRDWILTRILWLSGLEKGVNRLGDVDTMQRYIYIHGTPDSEPMGVARSHGCIRMRNKDLLWLFSRVPVGAKILIKE